MDDENSGTYCINIWCEDEFIDENEQSSHDKSKEKALKTGRKKKIIEEKSDIESRFRKLTNFINKCDKWN